MPLERRDYAERSVEREYDETPENPGNEEIPNETERTMDEKELQNEVERVVEKVARELDETEARQIEIEDIVERVARSLDELEREDRVEKKESLENELNHDIDEVRDELHEEYVNDVKRQLEGISRKDIESDGGSGEGASSERTEVCESCEDAGTEMVYAMETKNESEPEDYSEIVREVENEEREDREGSELTDDVEVSPNEEFRNRITKQEFPETEEEEHTTSDSKERVEKQEFHQPEYSEPLVETKPEVSEGGTRKGDSPKFEHEKVRECTPDNGLDSASGSEECDVESGLVDNNEVEESSDVSEMSDEPELEELERVDEPIEDSDVGLQSETESPEMGDDVQPNMEPSESEIEDGVSEIDEISKHEILEAEDFPEELEDFVKRVQDIMDGKMSADEDYDYVQNPLTGEMQRVPRVLSEYETEEQRYRRKLRNLFVELSDEERERFKELVRERAESEEEHSAEAIEKKWASIVAKAEQESNEIDVQKVHHLYFEKSLSMLEVGWKLGFKSTRPVQRIFREQGWEARVSGPQRKSQDYAEMSRLYYEKGYTLREIAEKFGMDRHTIGKIFKEQGWVTRRAAAIMRSESISEQTETRLSKSKLQSNKSMAKQTLRKLKLKENRTKRSINPMKVYKLYFADGLTMMDISKKLGFKSTHHVSQLFKRMGWKPFRGRSYRKTIDVDEVYRLYYIKGLTKEEVVEELDIPESRLRKVFKEMEWASKIRKFETDEERALAKKESAKETSQRIKDLREEIFGTKCRLCGQERKLAIHKKDGTEHERDVLWRIKFLKSVNIDDWAALCIPCHRGVHWMMEELDYNWEDIESLARRKQSAKLKSLEPLSLPEVDAPSSGKYLELKSKFEGNHDELRKAIFGDSCHFCAAKTGEKKIPIHRKDGRNHPGILTRSEKYYRTLNPDEWVLLCSKHHRYVHWAMDTLNLKWDDMKSANK
ncbi:MAG: hypothetical protein ACFFDD_08555 [Promethearchaeota archaeon]